MNNKTPTEEALHAPNRATEWIEVQSKDRQVNKERSLKTTQEDTLVPCKSKSMQNRATSQAHTDTCKSSS
jgi:hypothetical protein